MREVELLWVAREEKTDGDKGTDQQSELGWFGSEISLQNHKTLKNS